MKKFRKIVLFSILFIILIVGLAILSLKFYSVQNKIAHELAHWLSNKTNTKVEIKNVKINWFKNLKLEGVYIEDIDKDTFAYLDNLYINGHNLLNDNRIINDIEIDGLNLNAKRADNDSLWNYEILFANFNNTKTSNKKQNEVNFKLALDNLSLKNISIQQTDEYSGEDMGITADEIFLKVDSMNLDKMRFIASGLKANEIYMKMKSYDKSASKIKWSKTKRNKVEKTEKKNGLYVFIKNTDIKKSKFTYQRNPNNNINKTYFDENNINLENLNADIKNLKFENEKIYANIDLECNETKGFKLNQLKSDIVLTSTKASFENLSIKTNKSSLGNKINFNYGSIDNLSDFINVVEMKGNFANSNVSSDDISFFAPELNNWNINAQIDGDFLGTVNHFVANINSLKTSETEFKGRVKIDGLPDIDSSILDIQSQSLYTNYNEIVKIAPQLKDISAVHLNKLGKVNFIGDFKGYYNDFKSTGLIKTESGDISVKNFFMNMKEKNPIYGGNLDFSNIKLEELIDDLPVKNSKGNVVFEAHGFDPKDISITSNGELNSVSFMGYTLQGVKFKSDYKNGISTNVIDGNSEYISGILNVEYQEDKENTNHIKINGDLKKIDFKKIGLLHQNLKLKGKINADLYGDFTKNFHGFAEINDAKIENTDTITDFDYIRLEAIKDNGNYAYTLITDQMQGFMKGNFSFDELSPLVENLMYNYFPSYFKKSKNYNPNTFASFSVKGNNLSKIINIFNKDIKTYGQVDLTGFLNSENIFSTGSLSDFQYKDYLLKNINLNLSGNNTESDDSISCENFIVGKNSMMQDVLVKTTIANNMMNITASSKGKSIKNNKLEMKVQALGDSFFVNINPSIFEFNDKLWTIKSEGNIVYSKNYLDIPSLKINNNDQEIKVYSNNNFFNNSNGLKLEVNNMKMKDFFDSYLGSNPSLSSTANGVVLIDDIFNKPILSTNILFSNLEINENSIGDAKIISSYDITNKNLLILNSSGIVKDDTWIHLSGNLNTDSGHNNKILLEAENYDFTPLEPYLHPYVYNFTGKLNGSAEITGSIDKPHIEGFLDISNTSFYVDQLGSAYKIPSMKVNLYTDSIRIVNTELKDIYNQNANFGGIIYHHNFDNFNFDLELKSDKFLCLNSNEQINPQFYGKIISDINASLIGNIKDLKMLLSFENISSGEIYIVNVTEDNSSDYNFISFVNTNTTSDTLKFDKTGYKLVMDIDANINPKTKINMIIDPTDNSTISAVGNGNLTIRMPFGMTNEELTVSGLYKIKQGNMVYFNSQNYDITTLFGTKKFDIENGSTVIMDGDPMKAIIHGSAIYTTPKITLESLFDPNELTSNSMPADQLREIKTKQRVDVVISLDGTIDDLDKLNYSIKLPDLPNSSNPAYAKLQQLTSTKEALQTQAGYLLTLNTFKTDKSSTNNTNSDLTSTALINFSSLLTSTTANKANDLIKKALRTDAISLNVDIQMSKDQNTISYLSNLSPVVVLNGNVKLVKDNSLNLDFKVGQNIIQTSNSLGTTGEVNLNFSKPGAATRLYTYYKTVNDNNFYNSAIPVFQTGFGISSNKNFDNYKELFYRIKKDTSHKK